jgi:hypothetical protein
MTSNLSSKTNAIVPGVNATKLPFFVTETPQTAGVLICGKPFHPSLTFGAEAGAYPSKVPTSALH